MISNRPRSARHHREAAGRLAARNCWDQALQERTRAVLRSLEEADVLTAGPGRSAEKVAAEGGRAFPELAGALVEAAAAFNAVTYGRRAAQAHEYHRVCDRDAALPRPSRSPGPPPHTGEDRL